MRFYVTMDNILFFFQLKHISFILNTFIWNIIVVNQWENIEYIACPGNSTRCIDNGEDVLNIMSVKKVIFKKNLIKKIVYKI